MSDLAPRSKRLLLALVAVLALAHLAFAIFVNPAGYLTYDSGMYHYMAKNFAETGGFILRNGYEEYPSPELRVAQMRIAGDHLVSQYPEILTVLALPFYLVLGYQGLLVLNALCFLLVNVLVFQLARLLFDDERLAWTSVAVYSLATFAWEYSHSSYPHLSSTLFVLASWYCLARAIKGREQVHLGLCAFAGLFAGLGVGLRLDAAFAIPGLFVPLLFRPPLRLAPMLALAAGLAPGLLFLSAVNVVKFGVFSPLEYGRSNADDVAASLKWYLPIFLLSGLLTLFLMGAQRLPAARRKHAGWVLAALVALAAAFFPAALWRMVSQLVDGVYQIVVDLRIRPLDLPEPGLMRSSRGAMVYIGGVKKSLLQSCSYLAVVPLLAFGARPAELRRLAFLAIVPASFVGYYGYLAWHGSVALNMRYLNPILPFTSILAALAWRRVAEGARPRRAALWAGGLLLVLTLIFARARMPIADQEFWLLTLPLVLAAALFLSEIARRLRFTPTLGAPLVAYLMLTSFAYSGAMAFGRDYPASARVRDTNLQLAGSLAPFIEDDSLLVSNVVDICWGLLDEVEDLRIALPRHDGYESFPGLAKHHLDQGRRVYMALTPGEFQSVGNRGLLDDFETRVIHVWGNGGQPSLFLLGLERRPSEAAP